MPFFFFGWMDGWMDDATESIITYAMTHTSKLVMASSSFAPRFDRWNSSSTGHQQAPEDGKRRRRSTKATNRLAAQFRHASSSFSSPACTSFSSPPSTSTSTTTTTTNNDDDDDDDDDDNKKKTKTMGNNNNNNNNNSLFAGVVVYIDGCTAPLVSDHRLRCLLVSHGATLATRLARRVVTHVVLSVGRRDATTSTSPANTIMPRNALAASKVEAELRRRRVAGVRYVDVRWFVFFSYSLFCLLHHTKHHDALYGVLESIEAGKRLPETRFPALLVSTGPILRFNNPSAY
ncbi:hypothetical protein L249_1577 [Ophiocordyceps polyrhachis-furcata BCC 54312]|uniref:BRCT domain-containing protein n=1 Tax=Ophiocordyceps polyrhachis-furcata BCC 54312 TaxID=1330021 RepID=A0A367L4X1_9HYPO|nr:hypothetical protein L249_1577 [Ophiocordyceps polyrhachis-furcata BCC 54312]